MEATCARIATGSPLPVLWAEPAARSSPIDVA
jgi:hypothetical protein